MSKLISIGQIIDLSWSHYTKHFQGLMKISLWFFLVPLIMLVSTIMSPIGDPYLLLANGQLGIVRIIGLLIGGIGTVIVSPVLGVWIFLNLAQVIDLQSKNKKINYQEANQKAWKLFFPYIWATILKGVAIMLPILFMVPGLLLIILDISSKGSVFLGALSILLTFLGVIAAFVFVMKLGVELYFVEYDVALGYSRGLKALKASRSLASGRWFQVFWRIFLPNLLFAIGVVVIELALLFVFTLLMVGVVSLGPNGFTAVNSVVNSILGFGIAAL
ncbi:MAG: hypothetical protein ABH846_01720, partial [Patescibacteria group bacterium]